MKASIRLLRMTPRKVRVVANAVRGKTVNDAIKYLNFCKKRAALPIMKVIKSAAANADYKGSVSVDDLKIAMLRVDEGPTMKRFMPRARGMATPILKRTSKVSVELIEL